MNSRVSDSVPIIQLSTNFNFSCDLLPHLSYILIYSCKNVKSLHTCGSTYIQHVCLYNIMKVLCAQSLQRQDVMFMKHECTRQQPTSKVTLTLDHRPVNGDHLHFDVCKCTKFEVCGVNNSPVIQSCTCRLRKLLETDTSTYRPTYAKSFWSEGITIPKSVNYESRSGTYGN